MEVAKSVTHTLTLNTSFYSDERLLHDQQTLIHSIGRTLVTHVLVCVTILLNIVFHLSIQMFRGLT